MPKLSQSSWLRRNFTRCAAVAMVVFAAGTLSRSTLPPEPPKSWYSELWNSVAKRASCVVQKIPYVDPTQNYGPERKSGIETQGEIPQCVFGKDGNSIISLVRRVFGL